MAPSLPLSLLVAENLPSFLPVIVLLTPQVDAVSSMLGGAVSGACWHVSVLGHGAVSWRLR